MNWILENYFELIAVVLGLVSIFFQIRQHPWYWPVSMIMVNMYILIYYNAKLYAEISLQVYYLVVSIYGWYLWVFGVKVNDHTSELGVSKTSARLWVILTVIAITLFFLLGWILENYTDTDVPYWDSFITALSFIATWMLARKKLENWLVWIVVDAISIGIYLYKGLYPTMILFGVLTGLAVVGYYKWLMELKTKS